MRTREQVLDEVLVLAAQAGRGEAFDRLALRWQPRLERLAMSREIERIELLVAQLAAELRARG